MARETAPCVMNGCGGLVGSSVGPGLFSRVELACIDVSNQQFTMVRSGDPSSFALVIGRR
jgi:hypothetical protein